jgi:hypothetical protein
VLAILDIDLLHGSIRREIFSLQERNWEPPLADGCARPRVGKPDAAILWFPPYESRGQEFSPTGRRGRFLYFLLLNQRHDLLQGLTALHDDGFAPLDVGVVAAKQDLVLAARDLVLDERRDPGFLAVNPDL